MIFKNVILNTDPEYLDNDGVKEMLGLHSLICSSDIYCPLNEFDQILKWKRGI